MKNASKNYRRLVGEGQNIQVGKFSSPIWTGEGPMN
jgi:hypothetical protein